MKIHIYDSYCKVEEDLTMQEKAKLKRILSARPAGFMFMPKYKKGYWDGYVRLFINNEFPAGLFDLVASQINCVVVDHRKSIDHITSNYTIPNFVHRYYQIEAIEQVLSIKHGVLKMAPNAGKTLIIASIIKSTNYKAVVIVPTRALLMQTSNDLTEMLSINIGVFGSGESNKQDVTVTTMASLSRLCEEDLSDNILVVVDECHHVQSNQVFDNIFKIPGRFRIGCSATPLKLSKLADMKLVGATGNIIYEITNEDLISGNYSTPPEITFTHVSTLEYFQGTYQESYAACIVDNVHRNSSIAKLAIKEQQRGSVLIIASWIQHAKNIQSIIPNCLYADGNNSTNHITKTLQKFNNSNHILVCTPIFGEGINIPELATLILSGGGKSHIRLVQYIGRGMRKAINKSAFHVHDFIDDTNEYLIKQSELRYKLYKSEGFKVRMMK